MEYSKLTIVIDKREKKYHLAKRQWESVGVTTELRKLDSADYTFIYDGVDYSDLFLVEKKGSWGELQGNLMTKDHARIKREFARLLDIPYVVLLIEEPKGIDGIDFMRLYSFKMSKARFKATYTTFIQLRQRSRKIAKKPPIEVVYCKKIDTANTILSLIMKYYDIYHKENQNS